MAERGFIPPDSFLNQILAAQRGNHLRAIQPSSCKLRCTYYRFQMSFRFAGRFLGLSALQSHEAEKGSQRLGQANVVQDAR